MPTPYQFILTLNAGSSSIKLALFEAHALLKRVLYGGIDRLGTKDSQLVITGESSEHNHSRPLGPQTHQAAVEVILEWASQQSFASELVGIGHRIVHGGPNYSTAVQVTADTIKELRRLCDFAPLHLPAALALLEGFADRFARVPQVACFDTTFHHDLPRVAKMLPLPRRFEAQGIRHYGFHGLSYTSLMRQLENAVGLELSHRRTILAHIGNGTSLAAVHSGKCIDTTMSFTPAGGVPMSTRTGNLDPGLMGYVMRTEKLTAEQFTQMANFKSGLLGMSGTSSDMRELLEREARDIRAAEAIAVFCYELKKTIGAYAAALGGLDNLVFSGGIGENAAPVRERICQGLDFLGVKIDQARNAAHAPKIGSDDSRVGVHVIRTNEELVVAETTRDTLRLARSVHMWEESPYGEGPDKNLGC